VLLQHCLSCPLQMTQDMLLCIPGLRVQRRTARAPVTALTHILPALLCNGLPWQPGDSLPVLSVPHRQKRALRVVASLQFGEGSHVLCNNANESDSGFNCDSEASIKSVSAGIKAAAEGQILNRFKQTVLVLMPTPQ